MTKTPEWFVDLDGQPVEAGSLPVAKLFVLDPERELDRDWILYVLEPDPWEQVVITNATTIESLAAFAGAYESKGQARKAGYSGPVFFGIEVYGTRTRSFFAWNPKPPASPPTLSPKRLLTEEWWFFLREMGWTRGRR